MISALNSITGLSYENSVVAKLVDSSLPMTSKTFNIFIPSLMPLLTLKDTSVVSLNIGSRVVNNKRITAKNISTQSFMSATSMTDYRIRYDQANVWEMESSKTTTEKAVAFNGPFLCALTGAPHTDDHNHQLIQPIELHNFKMETLNIHDVSQGDELTVHVFSMEDLRVVNIPGKVPQNGD